MGGYTVTVPTLPGCITYGATFEEATANIREALLLCLEEGLAETSEGSLSGQHPILSSIEFSPEEIVVHA